MAIPVPPLIVLLTVVVPPTQMLVLVNVGVVSVGSATTVKLTGLEVAGLQPTPVADTMH